MKVLDSFAWFEYFSGSEAGKVVEKIVASREQLGTPASCLAEFKRKRRREGKPWEKEVAFIEAKSAVLPLSGEIALRSGDIGELHFADALVYATALAHNAVLVTGDSHFKGLPGVSLLQGASRPRSL